MIIYKTCLTKQSKETTCDMLLIEDAFMNSGTPMCNPDILYTSFVLHKQLKIVPVTWQLCILEYLLNVEHFSSAKV